MGVGPSTRPPGSNHGRQAGRGGEDLPVDRPRCPRVARRTSRTNYGRVCSLPVAFYGGSHGPLIGWWLGSRGDVQFTQHVRESVSGGTHCTGTGEFVFGEASHPGPPLLRRLRSGRSRGVRADISSEEPLVRHIQRHVVPRIAGVASVAEENDISDVEDHSAVSPTLLDSLAEDLSEARPYTNLRDVGRIGVQILPSVDRGADECSWASSESCWGEREDIGEEEGRMECIVSSTVRPSRGWQRPGGAEESRVGPSRVTGPQSVQDRESPSTMPATTHVDVVDMTMADADISDSGQPLRNRENDFQRPCRRRTSRRVHSSGSEGVPQVRQSPFTVLTRESEENMPARIGGSEASRQDGEVQSRSNHVAVVALDVDDPESEVSMGTALEQDLAVSPRQFERQEVATELDCTGTVATVIEANEDNLSDTISVEFQNPEARRRVRRRLILTSQNQPLAAEIPDSHDRRFARVREAVQRERRASNSVGQVEAAAQSVRLLTGRVGRWNGEDIPREIRRHQLSAFNVPLMWAAAEGDSCPVLGWLAGAAQNLVINVGGEEVPGPEAVIMSWEALRNVFQTHQIHSREHLAEWIHRQGFPMPRWGSHFSGRAQERILTLATSSDGRVAGLEASYVRITLAQCQEGQDETQIPCRVPRGGQDTAVVQDGA